MEPNRDFQDNKAKPDIHNSGKAFLPVCFFVFLLYLKPMRSLSNVFLLILLFGGCPSWGAEPPTTILILGDSLTAGYGLENPGEAYPHRLQELLSQRHPTIPTRVIPAGLSGETTAGGLRRINWVLRAPRDWPENTPFALDIFIIALGGNDGLRGIDISDTRKNLKTTIDKVLAKYPQVQVVVAGMEMPVNMGEDYRDAFRESFKLIAEETDAVLIPFLLKGVGGYPELMQADQIHPNPDGHRKMAELVYEYLLPMIKG